jgi:hypothetical protein
LNGFATESRENNFEFVFVSAVASGGPALARKLTNWASSTRILLPFAERFHTGLTVSAFSRTISTGQNHITMPDFSTPAEHAFEDHTPDPSSTTHASLSNASIPLYERYEIPSTISEILSNGYQTVALQFPDELLGESVLVYRALMKGIMDKGGEKAKGVQCYVLGDSTYGR